MQRLELKSKNLFIGDVHFSQDDKRVLNFIKNIDKNEVNQIIFMGDIFDILVGNADIFLENNQELIDVINSIDEDIEVVFLEGNHDMNMSYVLKNAKIFDRDNQPILLESKSTNFLISHGDIYANKLHELYMNFIRNRYVLSLLLFINIFTLGKIENLFYSHLTKKHNCNEIPSFSDIVENRVKVMSEHVDFKTNKITHIIEAHFHQNKVYNVYNIEYINMPAFVCKEEVMHIEIEDLTIKRGSYGHCLH